jgi:acetate kinase
VNVLCLNSGSSSLKFTGFEIANGLERRLVEGAVEALDSDRPRAWFADDGVRRDVPIDRPDVPSAIRAIFEIAAGTRTRVDAVGHRVVFGGNRHIQPERIDAALIADLRSLEPLAPEHLPAAVDGIDAALRAAPGVPHVACFDTAFHQQMPDIARRLPLSDEWHDRGVQRYGFHGLSYEYIVSVLGPEVRGRVVVAHLGHGASMAALRDGAPMDTTMGLTPTGGLVMSTRTGDLDPGVVLHLAYLANGDLTAVGRLLTHDAGLRGVSGISGDMQQLLAVKAERQGAARAIALFCYSARKHLAAMAAVLGGLDTLVFTGGIGERADAIRTEICAPLSYLGIALDAERNARNAAVISAPTAPCIVRVITTDENVVIARHTCRIAGGPGGGNLSESGSRGGHS